MLDPVFKAGDRVRCMRSASCLREGEEFIVTDYYQGILHNMCVDLLDMQGRSVTYVYASRFELVHNGDTPC